MNDRIWSIQYLRALAALGVVLFHAMQSHPSKFAVGAAGVDIFFVISGFIMASLALGRESSPGTFLWRRIIRIAPLYWMVTLLVAAILVIQPLAFYNGDPSFKNVSLSLAFFPHFANDRTSPVVMQGWTLEYEMFFYVLFAAALFAPARIRLQLLCGVMALLVLIGLIFPAPHIRAWYVYTDPLLLEFVLGVGLAVAWRRNLLPPPLVGAAAIIIGFAVYALSQAGIVTSSHRLIHWGLPAALIVGGALSLEVGGKIVRSRFGALLGDASYSLYLTHTLLIAFLGWFWPQMSLWLYLPLCIAGSIAIAIASYILIERPLTNALKSLGRRRKTPRGATPSVRSA